MSGTRFLNVSERKTGDSWRDRIVSRTPQASASEASRV